MLNGSTCSYNLARFLLLGLWPRNFTAVRLMGSLNVNVDEGGKEAETGRWRWGNKLELVRQLAVEGQRAAPNSRGAAIKQQSGFLKNVPAEKFAYQYAGTRLSLPFTRAPCISPSLDLIFNASFQAKQHSSPARRVKSATRCIHGLQMLYFKLPVQRHQTTSGVV